MFKKFKIKLRIQEVSRDIKLISNRYKRLVHRPKLKDIPDILDNLEDLIKQKKLLKRFKQRLLYQLDSN